MTFVQKSELFASDLREAHLREKRSKSKASDVRFPEHSVRYLPPRGPDGEDRRLRSGHSKVSLERLSPVRAAVGVDPLDGQYLFEQTHHTAYSSL